MNEKTAHNESLALQTALFIALENRDWPGEDFSEHFRVYPGSMGVLAAVMAEGESDFLNRLASLIESRLSKPCHFLSQNLDPDEKLAQLAALAHAPSKKLMTMLHAGWKPSPAGVGRVAQQACWDAKPELLVELAERSMLCAVENTVHGDPMPAWIIGAFREQNEKDLVSLKALASLRVLKDAPGFLGPTDFLVHHQFKIAQEFLSMGFKYRPLGQPLAPARGLPPGWLSLGDGFTVFHALAKRSGGHALKLARMLEGDPHVKPLLSQRDQAGRDALMIAAGELNLDQAQFLLQAGANPNALDDKGWTPLRHAGRKYGAKGEEKCARMIALLLDAGADPSIADKKGLTAGQAMAKKAPIQGLATLLKLRPEDLVGESEAAKKTSESLVKRGGRALSLVEDVIMDSEVQSPAAQKKSRSRL